MNQAVPQDPGDPADTAFDGVDLSQAEVAIGIPIFDIEHHEMLVKLQDLYAAIAADAPHEAVLPLLARLAEVSRQHFAHEEQYMRDYRYPDTARHIDDHNALAGNLAAFVAASFSANVPASQRLATIRAFFRRWLLDHILEHDLALANFLVQKNIR